MSGTLGTHGHNTGTSLGGRARQVADAAIAVLAEHGARGLTHRAVDQAAGLSPGTTSNYARTREALLTLTLTRIAELDLAEGAAGVAGSGLADDVAQMVHQWIIEPGRRRRFLARLELAFEATRRPELRAAYDEMGRGFRTEAARLLAAAGSAHPERDAWTLIAWVEGTAFYALAGRGRGGRPVAGRAPRAGHWPAGQPVRRRCRCGMIVVGSGQ